MKEMTNVTDTEGQPIPYGVLLDFTWWGGIDGMDEYHCKCKIRKRKRGDIFEFVEDIYGRKCHFTHRLSALNWTVDDLLIIDKNYDIQNS